MAIINPIQNDTQAGHSSTDFKTAGEIFLNHANIFMNATILHRPHTVRMKIISSIANTIMADISNGNKKTTTSSTSQNANAGYDIVQQIYGISREEYTSLPLEDRIELISKASEIHVERGRFNIDHNKHQQESQQQQYEKGKELAKARHDAKVLYTPQFINTLLLYSAIREGASRKDPDVELGYFEDCWKWLDIKSIEAQSGNV